MAHDGLSTSAWNRNQVKWGRSHRTSVENCFNCQSTSLLPFISALTQLCGLTALRLLALTHLDPTNQLFQADTKIPLMVPSAFWSWLGPNPGAVVCFNSTEAPRAIWDTLGYLKHLQRTCRCGTSTVGGQEQMKKVGGPTLEQKVQNPRRKCINSSVVDT